MLFDKKTITAKPIIARRMRKQNTHKHRGNTINEIVE